MFLSTSKEGALKVIFMVSHIDVLNTLNISLETSWQKYGNLGWRIYSMSLSVPLCPVTVCKEQCILTLHLRSNTKLWEGLLAWKRASFAIAAPGSTDVALLHPQHGCCEHFSPHTLREGLHLELLYFTAKSQCKISSKIHVTGLRDVENKYNFNGAARRQITRRDET